MKFVFLILISIFVLSSCANLNTKKNSATALSLSPELTYAVTLMHRCEVPFWQTQFGRLVSENVNSKNIDLKTFFLALEQRPKACSLTQAMNSARLITNITLAIRKQKTITETELTQRFHSIQYMLIKNDLSFAELLVGLALFEEAEKIYSTQPKIKTVLQEIKKDLFLNQNEILNRTIKHDLLIIQSFAYRMELMDWTMEFDDYASKKIPTMDELEKYATYNKYQEILNLEKLKNMIIENQNCLSDKSCFFCNLNIQAQKCVQDQKAEAEFYLKNHSVFYFMFASKYADGIKKFKLKMKEFEN